ncbi:crossover junction endodeoxyribonuclease RuvC, partial [bacterium]
MIRVLGVDPGSRFTGWGIVEMDKNRLRHVAHGVISTKSGDPLPARLSVIHKGLLGVVAEFSPQEAGVEQIFSAKNTLSALKLGHARGVALLALEESSVPITEYTALQVKSAVAGYGKAAKEQVQEMVKRLLSLPEVPPEDGADALAVAICHGRTRST